MNVIIALCGALAKISVIPIVICLALILSGNMIPLIEGFAGLINTFHEARQFAEVVNRRL